jgi:hypothetical protein
MPVSDLFRIWTLTKRMKLSTVTGTGFEAPVCPYAVEAAGGWRRAAGWLTAGGWRLGARRPGLESRPYIIPPAARPLDRLASRGALARSSPRRLL